MQLIVSNILPEPQSHWADHCIRCTLVQCVVLWIHCLAAHHAAVNVHEVVAHYVVAADAAALHCPIVVAPFFPCDILQNVPYALFDASILGFSIHARRDQCVAYRLVSIYGVNVRFLSVYQ